MVLRLISRFPRATKAFAVFAVVAIFSAPFIVAARGVSTRPAPPTPKIQTVGASVMLRLQREGAKVFDFRKSGQAIRGAIRVSPQTQLPNSLQIVLIGDGRPILPHARYATQQNPKTQVYLVPSRFVAACPNFPNVNQIAPRAAYRLMQTKGVRVFDFAESEEFDYARIEGSTRIAWTRVLQNDFLAIQNCGAKTVLLICPVGSRSQIVAQKLSKLGVRVLNIRGGTFAWQNAGLPVEGGSTHATK
jgi:rhodanese-related sulfurtransferase